MAGGDREEGLVPLVAAVAVVVVDVVVAMAATNHLMTELWD